jgi:asparagine synthase (glutamine-hydrolysing)
MCGILGLLSPSAQQRRSEFIRARDLMEHRGPDDAGLYTEPGVLLGFRRLSILDLSPAGHQPMTSADGRVTLVFNGEIYNFRVLRQRLAQSHEFHSETDSEVILNGYLEWGWPGLLRRLDGMFAFSLWDAQERILYAARDRAGKKPFFYAERPDGLIFSSTLNAVASLLPSSEVDPQGLDAYLTYQALPTPLTMLKGVHQLPPAHALRYDVQSHSLHVERYWDLDFEPKLSLPEDQVLDQLDALLRAAVRKRLVSDVPLGAFLSGGVDSSLVVSLMAQEQQSPVEAVVMGFDDAAFDERPYARAVAQKWDVNLHEHVLRPNMIDDLPEIIWHYGQPLADVSIVPTYYVAKAAREHVTVVLNGDGGDEVFGGYARPMVARAAQTYRRLVPSGLRRVLGRTLKNVNGHPLLKRTAMLATAGQSTAQDAFVYDRAFRPYRDDAYAAALKQDVDTWHPDALYRDVWERAAFADDVDRALYGDFTTYLPDQLLTKMDVSTMAHSVEARSPLLDTDVVEFAARIPTALRLKGYTTKYLLKRLAERYVPHDVLYRRKRGFVMPASDWLRTDLAPYLRAALLDSTFDERGWIEPSFVGRMVEEHTAGSADWGEQLWTLFVLEIWSRMMLDGTLRRHDSLEALL